MALRRNSERLYPESLHSERPFTLKTGIEGTSPSKGVRELAPS